MTAMRWLRPTRSRIVASVLVLGAAELLYYWLFRPLCVPCPPPPAICSPCPKPYLEMAIVAVPLAVLSYLLISIVASLASISQRIAEHDS